ncbi:MAG: DNA-directed DNA polymerase II small subunit [Nitrososphaerales archaeon]
MFSLSSVQKALEVALDFGYQIDPSALKLLVKLGEKRREKTGESDPSLEAIIKEAIALKAKSQSGLTIQTSDLKEVFPMIFDFLDVPVVPPEGPKRMEAGSIKSDVEIVEDPSGEIQPTGIEGFPQLFKSRYEKILHILMERPEARQITKISKVNMEKGNVKIAGLVYGKRPTKNGGIEVTLDDDSGRAIVLALSQEAKKDVGEVTLDQCVMIEAEATQGRLLVKNIMQPDIPSKVASTSKKTVYAILLSDLHVGSDKFLEGAFIRFLEWVGGRGGMSEEDEEIVRRLKYVVIGGDVVDGVGVFPNQEFELSEQNIFKQYEMVNEKLKLIPKHLQMFVIPGNHDATRQALPQPMIPKKYAESLHKLENLKMLGDPCLLKLHGVLILSYHGRSLDDVLATTPGLSYERPEEAMKVLLKARHLAPIFGHRTPIAPEIEDHLVIDEVPDIFHAGHVHTVGQDRYKSTVIINSGTWQAQTGYQANLGISPRPGLVPVVNLSTLDVVWRDFLTSSSINSQQAG